MPSTLELDESWDLKLSVSNEIGVLDNAEAMAQDAASAIKTFYGEVFYDTSIGVPYLTQILAQAPALTLVKQWLIDAALRVPGVVSAQCYLTSLSNREVSGQVQVVSSTGDFSAKDFVAINPQIGAAI